MRDFKKLLRKIPKLYNEYYYPTDKHSLFLMPDGKLYGKSGLMQHSDMVEEMIGRKVDDPEFIRLMAEANLCRVNINRGLYLDCMADPTSKQIATLRDLVNYGNYFNTVILTFPNIIPDSPSENQIRNLLGIGLLDFSLTSHSSANVPEHRLV